MGPCLSCTEAWSRLRTGQPLRTDPVHETAAVQEACAVDLFSKDSLIRWLKWADVRLLDVNWLVAAPLDVIKNRRQELPQEAFVPVDKLRTWRIVSLSYGWADPANPDPQGDYATMLKKFYDPDARPGWAARRVRRVFGRKQQDIRCEIRDALFWDHKSLYQHRLRPDWDGQRDTFAENLIQRRTPAEEVAFRRAMGGMQALYFHSHKSALIAQDVPKGGRNPQPYENRGWTAMECAGVCLTGRVVALDLHGRTDKLLRKALVPMTAADFESEVASRTFFREEDRAEIVRMYRDGLAAFARSSKMLAVNVGDGDDQKCAWLAGALPHFERLEQLQLDGYPAAKPTRCERLDLALDAIARGGCIVYAASTSARRECLALALELNAACDSYVGAGIQNAWIWICCRVQETTRAVSLNTTISSDSEDERPSKIISRNGKILRRWRPRRGLGLGDDTEYDRYEHLNPAYYPERGTDIVNAYSAEEEDEEEEEEVVLSPVFNASQGPRGQDR